MLRKFFASLAIGCVLVSAASAALTGTVTLSRDPMGAPPVTFNTDTGLNSAPNDGWVSFILGVSNDSGVITGIDASITGNLLQRWTIAEGDEGPVTTPTPNITGTTNGDSHLLASTNALVGAPLTENNNVNNGAFPFPADTETRDYGIGSSLTGAWGIPAAEQAAHVDFGYIVVPRSAVAQGIVNGLDLIIQLGLPGGAFETLNTSAFVFPNLGGDVEVNTPPTVGDLGPLVGDMSLNGPGVETLVSGLVPATDNQDPTPLTWSILSADPTNPGTPVFAPSINGSGMFSWNVDGSKGGTYKFTVQGTDNGLPGTGGLLSDTGIVTVNVIVPEPATMSMIGLALVGLVGFTRRRS